ncbi:MAG: acetyl-CoA carboxylase biotin carboxyl carrier protein [Planctomycetaceae bacterium]|nr:acetyl-CoA carboxylase biotin carboxyl carrier protein [Planctomycetaceae bacterium]
MKEKNSEQNVFDIQQVRQLVELMQEFHLSEIDLQQDDMRICLKKNTLQAITAPVVSSSQIFQTPQTAIQTTAPPQASVASNESDYFFVKSPMVGTFYASPNPDSPAFVNVGDTIGHDTTVCILEAMKVFNEIQAECSGKVVAVLVKNGESVEYGKPLFKIDPRG